ncbi:MAG: hypothetical protein WCP45_16515, partial [Verrucomicrobiota bacterium]
NGRVAGVSDFYRRNVARAGSRYVPLQQVGWVWGGKVSSADGWQAVTAKDQAAPVNPGGVECSDHPQWDGNTKADAEKPIQ